MSGQHADGPDGLSGVAVLFLGLFLVLAVAVLAAGVWWGFAALLSWMIGA